MLDYDFENSIAYWVCMTSRAFEQALNEELAPHGITYRQWQVLGWLALEGALSQSQLADHLRIEAPTLVGILDRMERDGWLVRQPDPEDRRKKLIHPTPKVKPVWNQIAVCARKVRSRAAEGLTEEELKTARKILAHMQANLRSEKWIKEPVL